MYEAAHLVGRFRLRSGRTADEYFDKYRFEADPVLLRAIAEQAAEPSWSRPVPRSSPGWSWVACRSRRPSGW